MNQQADIPAVRAICEITGKPLNADGRPDNWADRTVDELIECYREGGMDAASARFAEIIERDKPLMMDGVVVRGRFQMKLKQLELA